MFIMRWDNRRNTNSTNVSKTKIVIFRKRNVRLDDNIVFTYDGQSVDIVEYFTYLGVIFSSNGPFCKNKNGWYVRLEKLRLVL